MEEKNNKINFKTVLIGIITILMIISVFQNYNLKQDIKNMQSNYLNQLNSMQGQIDSIYDNVDNSLKKEASLLTAVDYEFGTLDKNTYKVDLTVEIVPKKLTEDMTLSIEIGSEIIKLTRDGNRFTGVASISIFDKYDVYPLLTIKTDKSTQTESLESIYFEDLRYKYIDSFVSSSALSESTTNDLVKISGDIHIYCSSYATETINEIKKFEIVEELNDTEISRTDATNLVLDDNSYFQGYRNTFNVNELKNLNIYAEIEDRYGLIHKIPIYTYPSDDSSVLEGAEQIYDKNGNILVNNE